MGGREVGLVVGLVVGYLMGFVGLHYGSGASGGQLPQERIIVKAVKVSLTGLSDKALKRWTPP
ncbi:MAG: hypothetical protein ACK42H_03015 [Planctomycetota bacterium]|jgi:hypothetical protein